MVWLKYQHIWFSGDSDFEWAHLGSGSHLAEIFQAEDGSWDIDAIALEHDLYEGMARGFKGEVVGIPPPDALAKMLAKEEAKLQIVKNNIEWFKSLAIKSKERYG